MDLCTPTPLNNRVGVPMKIVKALIDYSTPWSLPDIKFFTANQVIKKNGELVMGAGNALAVKKAIPAAPLIMGNGLLMKEKQAYVERITDGQFLGALATKVNWQNKSSLPFVIESLRKLYAIAKANPEMTLHVPYPAISNGGLTRDMLDQYVFQLPDNVIIYCNESYL